MSAESGGGANPPFRNLLFCAQPVVQFVAIFPAARLVELLRALADLVFELLRIVVARHHRWRFLRSINAHGVTLLLAQNYA
jgi:hypothetical protein